MSFGQTEVFKHTSLSLAKLLCFTGSFVYVLKNYAINTFRDTDFTLPSSPEDRKWNKAAALRHYKKVMLQNKKLNTCSEPLNTHML